MSFEPYVHCFIFTSFSFWKEYIQHVCNNHIRKFNSRTGEMIIQEAIWKVAACTTIAVVASQRCLNCTIGKCPLTGCWIKLGCEIGRGVLQLLVLEANVYLLQRHCSMVLWSLKVEAVVKLLHFFSFCHKITSRRRARMKVPKKVKTAIPMHCCREAVRL